MRDNSKRGLISPSIFKNKPFGGISSDKLRLMATIFMILDHMWASVIPGNRWMTDVGRLAFPIYAFMISEGYVHSSDTKKYLKRLLFFAFVSEIPFNLFYSGYWLDPFNQNVLFTFVWGLLAIIQLDKIMRNVVFTSGEKPAIAVKPVIKALIMLCLISLGAKFTFTDYKFLGYLTVVMFYIARFLPFGAIFQIVSMYMLNWECFKGEILFIEILGNVLEIPNQAYRIFALIPIWVYNGKKKENNSRYAKYGFYIFYPVHMLILYFIQQVISSL